MVVMTDAIKQAVWLLREAATAKLLNPVNPAALLATADALEAMIPKPDSGSCCAGLVGALIECMDVIESLDPYSNSTRAAEAIDGADRALAAHRARQPDAFGLYHDRVHRDPGGARVAKTVRARQGERPGWLEERMQDPEFRAALAAEEKREACEPEPERRCGTCGNWEPTAGEAGFCGALRERQPTWEPSLWIMLSNDGCPDHWTPRGDQGNE